MRSGSPGNTVTVALEHLRVWHLQSVEGRAEWPSVPQFPKRTVLFHGIRIVSVPRISATPPSEPGGCLCLGLARPTENISGLAEWKEARRVAFTFPWPSCLGGRGSRRAVPRGQPAGVSDPPSLASQRAGHRKEGGSYRARWKRPSSHCWVGKCGLAWKLPELHLGRGGSDALKKQHGTLGHWQLTSPGRVVQDQQVVALVHCGLWEMTPGLVIWMQGQRE